MEHVEKLYENNNLIVRAMDMPNIQKINDDLFLDCSVWINEFEQMQEDKFKSVSSTLIVPNVPIRTYKNIGYLVDSSKSDCFHICKTDSGSSGNVLNGDFYANESDFEKVSDLANYIIETNHFDMNEINMNLTPDGVVGLFVNKCNNEKYLLKGVLSVRAAIKDFCDVELPIYEYDIFAGKISKIEITPELLEEINNTKLIGNIESYYYWTESGDIEQYGLIDNQNIKHSI